MMEIERKILRVSLLVSHRNHVRYSNRNKQMWHAAFALRQYSSGTLCFHGCIFDCAISQKSFGEHRTRTPLVVGTLLPVERSHSLLSQQNGFLGKLLIDVYTCQP